MIASVRIGAPIAKADIDRLFREIDKYILELEANPTAEPPWKQLDSSDFHGLQGDHYATMKAAYFHQPSPGPDEYVSNTAFQGALRSHEPFNPDRFFDHLESHQQKGTPYHIAIPHELLKWDVRQIASRLSNPEVSEGQ